MSMRDHHLENWISKVKLTGLALAVFVFAGLSASGQTQTCTLTDTSVSGATGAFTVTLEGTSLIVDPAGEWGAIQRMDTNANVQVTFTPPVPSGSEPVAITATELDPDQPGEFLVWAWDTNAHYIKVFATASCKRVPTGCTRTQGFWKNHADDWPVSSLMLGTVSYSKSQLLTTLRSSTKTNGLVSLAHQLIAAKLNVAAGAGAPAGVLTAISDADAMIGDLVVPRSGDGYLAPRQTSYLTTILDDYNNGLAPGGPDHCDN